MFGAENSDCWNFNWELCWWRTIEWGISNNYGDGDDENDDEEEDDEEDMLLMIVMILMMMKFFECWWSDVDRLNKVCIHNTVSINCLGSHT